MWRIIPSDHNVTSNLDVYLSSPFLHIIKSATKVTHVGRALFNDRLSGNYSNDLYTMTLKNVQYSDTKIFELWYRYGNHSSQGATISVTNVIGTYNT